MPNKLDNHENNENEFLDDCRGLHPAVTEQIENSLSKWVIFIKHNLVITYFIKEWRAK